MSVSLMVGLGLAAAFTAPAFAAGPNQPLTKSDCKKAGLKWNDQANIRQAKGR